MRKTKHVLMRAIRAVLCKRNYVVSAFASALVIFLFASLSACTPQGHAVGDSGHLDDIVHDGIDVEDIKLFVVGSRQAALDSKLLHMCEKSGLHASYTSIADVKNANFASQEAITDASNQPVSIIFINNINVDRADRVDSSVKSNAGGAHVDLKARKAWTNALEYARSAGIPVVLVNPQNPPKDRTLYAAKLYILKDLDGENLFDANLIKGFDKIQHSSLLKIVQSVIDNTPHSRDVVINDKD